MSVSRTNKWTLFATFENVGTRKKIKQTIRQTTDDRIANGVKCEMKYIVSNKLAAEQTIIERFRFPKDLCAFLI